MNTNFLDNQLTLLAKQMQIEQTKHLFTIDEEKTIRSNATRLLNNIFYFNKRWDMERCPKPIQVKPLDYYLTANHDDEWCYMLNRMDWLNYLIQAGLVDGKQKYFLKAKEYLLSWLNQHPLIKVDKTTRTLDTGIRLANWTYALIYLHYFHFLSKNDLTNFDHSVKQQEKFLQKHFISRYLLSNWGPIQLCGLLVADLAFNPRQEQSSVFNWALGQLKQALQIQILDDGMDWEQSPMYHIEILNYLLRLINQFRLLDLSLPTWIEQTARKMAYSIQQIIMPSGWLEAIGDSDRVQTGDLFARAAYLLHAPLLKYSGDKRIDAEDTYYLGAAATKVYQNLAVEKPLRKYFDGCDSGMYSIRSSWVPKANYLFFNNGSLGGGHGHCDNLQLNFSVHGKPLLIDSGRYTYRADDPMRPFLKSMYAHNSLILDDKPGSVPIHSWEYEKFGQPTKTYVRHRQHWHYLEGSVLFTDPLYSWTRKILYYDKGLLWISDEVRASSTHQSDLRWQIDPSWDIDQVNKRILLFNAKDDKYQLVANADIAVDQQIFSPQYNQLAQHPVLQVKKNFINKTVFNTFILPAGTQIKRVPILNKADDLNSANRPDRVEGYVIKTANMKYYLAMTHEEFFKQKRLMYMGGQPFFCHAYVLQQNERGKTSFRMKE